MYFRLPDNIALRSWKCVPRAYYIKNDPYAKGLTAEEYDLMLLCDGEHDLAQDGLTKSLESSGLIERCEKGGHSSEWSRIKTYPHGIFRK